MSNFVILNDVPVTKRTGGFGGGRGSSYPVANLLPGQCLFVEVEDEKKQRQRAGYLGNLAKKAGIKFATRTNQQVDGKIGVAIWRLAD